ncbi:hypothetical protein V6N13_033947 [Hibiscus sabdariffa]
MIKDNTTNVDLDHDKSNSSGSDKDEFEQDTMMPGFLLHPTEEELVEFYLRREVEGKRFNVELITFLDLYRYDPWELPGTESTETGIDRIVLRLQANGRQRELIA